MRWKENIIYGTNSGICYQEVKQRERGGHNSTHTTFKCRTYKFTTTSLSLLLQQKRTHVYTYIYTYMYVQPGV